MPQRSQELPEFARPPINELVLGVQFQQSPAYHQLMAGEFWRRIRSEYPRVEVQGFLPPQFETFSSGPRQPTQAFQLSFGPVPPSPRFWFLDESGHELVQFQGDRLLHNWRQVDGAPTQPDYPRYGAVAEKFQSALRELESFFEDERLGRLEINQAEISYFNRIYGDGRSFPAPDQWFKFLRFGDRRPESFNGSYREVIYRDDGAAAGRLYCEINPAIDPLGRPMLVFSLTFRGQPLQANRQGALDLIAFGREIIVTTFAEITTEEAHRQWQRQR